MRRLLTLTVFTALALAQPAPAGTGQALSGGLEELMGTTLAMPRAGERPRLTEAAALALALAEPKVAGWIARYEHRSERVFFERPHSRWTVKVWTSGEAGQIALVRVDDETGRVIEAWTGPQVAWRMARGYDGAFGQGINDPWVWLTFCTVFFLGLADLRRLRSLRNLDLLVLLSFSVSLWLFNEGNVFTAIELAYPPLLYLLLRTLWVGLRGRVGPARPLWPTWVLLGATVFLVGFRVGLNLQDSNVIDVGFAGVIGAQRIVERGEAPYGHMPLDRGRECGRPDTEGYVRDRIQRDGRCETANPRGDTYGPVSYLAYVPGVLLFGWSGRWDDLPAAHFTSILFDLLALIGLALVGWRFGGKPLAVTLAFAWAAYPFSQYVSSSNTNDAIMPALAIFGFWLCSSPFARGAFSGLAAWTKFAMLVTVPLWLTYPGGLRPGIRPLLLALGGFALSLVLAFWLLALEPDPLAAARLLWDRTFGWQLSRPSPFSIWDWGQYPPYPDLGSVQTALKGLLAVAAVAFAFLPRRKTPLQLAALTATLLIGFELVLTHWFYLYIPWFYPFVAIALLAPLAAGATRCAE